MSCYLLVTLTRPGKGITPRVFQVFSADERMISSKEMSEKVRGDLAVDIKLDEVYASASKYRASANIPHRLIQDLQTQTDSPLR